MLTRESPIGLIERQGQGALKRYSCRRGVAAGGANDA
jgi:hypothetical protein